MKKKPVSVYVVYFFFTDVLPHPLSHVPNSFIGLRNRIVFMKWRFSFVLWMTRHYTLLLFMHFVLAYALNL